MSTTRTEHRSSALRSTGALGLSLVLTAAVLVGLSSLVGAWT